MGETVSNFSNELQRLLEEVADICDSGQYLNMRDGADTRYDGNSYGEGLLTAYQGFLGTKEGEEWYGETVEGNHRALFGG